eukprot:6209581-Pleurochrysis_carterae.AAC.1
MGVRGRDGGEWKEGCEAVEKEEFLDPSAKEKARRLWTNRELDERRIGTSGSGSQTAKVSRPTSRRASGHHSAIAPSQSNLQPKPC